MIFAHGPRIPSYATELNSILRQSLKENIPFRNNQQIPRLYISASRGASMCIAPTKEYPSCSDRYIIYLSNDFMIHNQMSKYTYTHVTYINLHIYTHIHINIHTNS